jgi:hypothetical protein
MNRRPSSGPDPSSAVVGFYGFLTFQVLLPNPAGFNPASGLTWLPRCTLMLFSQLKGVVPAREVRIKIL